MELLKNPVFSPITRIFRDLLQKMNSVTFFVFRLILLRVFQIDMGKSGVLKPIPDFFSLAVIREKV